MARKDDTTERRTLIPDYGYLCGTNYMYDYLHESVCTTIVSAPHKGGQR